jgi:glycine cleavage system transcriptional repressor
MAECVDAAQVFLREALISPRVNRFAVWALGADRPGIVAAVTGVLVEQGCNLEDTSMTILSGHFAMMLLVSGPDRLEGAPLEAALAEIGRRLDLVVGVRPVHDDATSTTSSGAPHVVSVYGADRPGIVHAISSLLADQGVNITDLNTRVIGEPDEPVYAMLLEVEVPVALDSAALEAGLRARAAELGVEASLHPVEADIL